MQCILYNIQGGYFDWFRPKNSKCQPESKFWQKTTLYMHIAKRRREKREVLYFWSSLKLAHKPITSGRRHYMLITLMSTAAGVERGEESVSSLLYSTCCTQLITLTQYIMTLGNWNDLTNMTYLPPIYRAARAAKNCDIWLNLWNLWNLAEIVKFSQNCEMLLKLWCRYCLYCKGYLWV